MLLLVGIKQGTVLSVPRCRLAIFVLADNLIDAWRRDAKLRGYLVGVNTLCMKVEDERIAFIHRWRSFWFELKGVMPQSFEEIRSGFSQAANGTVF